MKRFMSTILLAVASMILVSCSAASEKASPAPTPAPRTASPEVQAVSDDQKPNNVSQSSTNIAKSTVSIIEAANDPDKFRGRRVTWVGTAMGEIKAGDSQPMIVIEAGYIVIPKMSKPINAYASGTKLVVEGVYGGVGGSIGAFSPGGSPTGGAQILMVKDATVTPAS